MLRSKQNSNPYQGSIQSNKAGNLLNNLYKSTAGKYVILCMQTRDLIRPYLADTLSTGVDVMASFKAALTARARGKVPVAERAAIALLTCEPLFTHTLTWKNTCTARQETQPKANMIINKWKLKTTTLVKRHVLNAV